MSTQALARRARVEQVMGLPVSLHLRGGALTGDLIDERVAGVYRELRHVDAVLSPYRDDSELSRWERGTLHLEEADPMLANPCWPTRAGVVQGPTIRPVRRIGSRAQGLCGPTARWEIMESKPTGTGAKASGGGSSGAVPPRPRSAMGSHEHFAGGPACRRVPSAGATPTFPGLR